MTGTVRTKFFEEYFFFDFKREKKNHFEFDAATEVRTKSFKSSRLHELHGSQLELRFAEHSREGSGYGEIRSTIASGSESSVNINYKWTKEKYYFFLLKLNSEICVNV